MAAHFGSVAMVKQLLDAEVNVVDGQNELGYTPLHQAAQQGYLHAPMHLETNLAFSWYLFLPTQLSSCVAQD